MLGVSLGAVLQILLEPADAGLEVRKGAVWIVPLPRPQGLTQRLRSAPKRFQEEWNKPVTLKQGFKAGTPLLEALNHLSDLVELTLYVDTRAFERARVKSLEKQPIKLAAQMEVRLAVVLKELLDQVGARFVLRDNLVLIIPRGDNST